MPSSAGARAGRRIRAVTDSNKEARGLLNTLRGQQRKRRGEEEERKRRGEEERRGRGEERRRGRGGGWSCS